MSNVERAPKPWPGAAVMPGPRKGDCGRHRLKDALMLPAPRSVRPAASVWDAFNSLGLPPSKSCLFPVLFPATTLKGIFACVCSAHTVRVTRFSFLLLPWSRGSSAEFSQKGPKQSVVWLGRACGLRCNHSAPLLKLRSSTPQANVTAPQ